MATRGKHRNADQAVVDGFGDEWSRFSQEKLSDQEKERIFADYFSVFPLKLIGKDSVGADFGVGSGRWASLIAPKVGRLICVDASASALDVARRNLLHLGNCEFICASIEEAGIAQESLDFAYSLGVLHHMPDTLDAMRACVEKLKVGAPLLVYLYYRFDNKPRWYRWVWGCSELVRSVVSRSPHWLRYWASQVLALSVYWPLARLSLVLERLGVSVQNFPLSCYRRRSFYVMRTDALDRFGTRLEQRFTQNEILRMMEECGLVEVRFSSTAPFWCAVGLRGPVLPVAEGQER